MDPLGAHSIALIERLWRSIKGKYAHGSSFNWASRAIGSNLARYAEWFNEERPLKELGDLTSDDVQAWRRRGQRPLPLRAALHVSHLGDNRAPPVLSHSHAE